MKICAKCKVEMRCVKNGIIVRFGEDCCYSGDAYECPDCHAKIVTGFGERFYSTRPWPEDRFLQMND